MIVSSRPTIHVALPFFVFFTAGIAPLAHAKGHWQAQGTQQAGAPPPVAPSDQREAKAPRVERGFTPLFTGKASQLIHWQQINEKGHEGHFVFKDGTLMATGGMGLLWYTPRSYKDFILRADWKPSTAHANSGIFVRFPDPKGDPWNPVHQGHEIQIADDYDPVHRTGAVYDFQPSTKIVSGPDRWNTMEIQCIGAHYTIRVNGETVCEYDSARSREGYIGLQNHSDDDKVWFRNIRIREVREDRKAKRPAKTEK